MNDRDEATGRQGRKREKGIELSGWTNRINNPPLFPQAASTVGLLRGRNTLPNIATLSLKGEIDLAIVLPGS